MHTLTGALPRGQSDLTDRTGIGEWEHRACANLLRKDMSVSVGLIRNAKHTEYSISARNCSIKSPRARCELLTLMRSGTSSMCVTQERRKGKSKLYGIVLHTMRALTVPTCCDQSLVALVLSHFPNPCTPL